MPENTVLIAGAGPTGLTLACELARRGIALRIIDEADGPSTKSKALAIHARTLQILRDTGITAQLLSAGIRIHAVHMSAGGRELATISLAEFGGEYPFVLGLAQAETERILTERLAGLGPQVEWKTTLGAFEEEGDTVRAVVQHEDGRSEAVVTNWLAGCDGAHSSVRRALGFEFKGAEYPEQFLLADCKVGWQRDRNEAYVILHTDGVVAFFPLPDDRWRLIMALQRSAHDFSSAPPSLDAIEHMLVDRGITDAPLSDANWIAAFRIHRRNTDTMQRGRIFLAGDAAHIHSPAGGQGMNTGIQDAHNLGWKLALAVRGRAAPGLLESYGSEREPIARDVLKGTDALTRAATLSNSALAAMRNFFMHAFMSIQAIRERAAETVAELRVNYRDSPIVAGDGHFRGIKPGEYVGDFADRDNSGHTLLAPAEGGDLLPSWLSGDVTVRPMPADDEAGVCVIRPDGYLGFCAMQADAGALDAYWRKTFRP